MRCRLRESDIGPVKATTNGAHASTESRQVYFEETGRVDTSVLRVPLMVRGERYHGPLIVESPFTTVVIDPGASVELSQSGSLVISP